MSLRTQELCWLGLKLLAGSSLGGESRQKDFPGFQGWGLGVGLTTLPCKNNNLLCHRNLLPSVSKLYTHISIAAT